MGACQSDKAMPTTEHRDMPHIEEKKEDLTVPGTNGIEFSDKTSKDNFYEILRDLRKGNYKCYGYIMTYIANGLGYLDKLKSGNLLNIELYEILTEYTDDDLQIIVTKINKQTPRLKKANASSIFLKYGTLATPTMYFLKFATSKGCEQNLKHAQSPDPQDEIIADPDNDKPPARAPPSVPNLSLPSPPPAVFDRSSYQQPSSVQQSAPSSVQQSAPAIPPPPPTRAPYQYKPESSSTQSAPPPIQQYTHPVRAPPPPPSYAQPAPVIPSSLPSAPVYGVNKPSSTQAPPRGSIVAERMKAFQPKGGDDNSVNSNLLLIAICIVLILLIMYFINLNYSDCKNDNYFRRKKINYMV